METALEESQLLESGENSGTLRKVSAFLQQGDLFLDKYRIEGLIGKGGMGAVYAAVDNDLARRVAIKVLLPHIAENPQAVTRFINEGRAAARIEGEHVARVFAAGRTPEGVAYMVLELLEGADLAQLLRARRQWGITEAVDFLLEGLEAIAEAHHHGIVHRDLKPGNLFLARRTNGTEVVKVLDFGISKATNPFAELGTSDQHSLTSTRSTLGSPLYMSPEQLRSAKNVDRRSDIWSIGIIFYEMLAGTVPFTGESLGELFVAILEQDPVPIGHYRPDIPPELQSVVRACLERDPQRRIGDALQLAQALTPFAVRSRSSIDRIRGFGGRGPGQTVGMLPAVGAGTSPSQPGLSGSGSQPGLSGSRPDARSNPAFYPPAPRLGGSSGNMPGYPPMTDRSGQTTEGWSDPRTASASGSAVAPPKRSMLPWLVAVPVGLIMVGALVGALVFLSAKKTPTPVTAAPPPVTTITPLPTTTTAPAASSQAHAEPTPTTADDAAAQKAAAAAEKVAAEKADKVDSEPASAKDSGAKAHKRKTNAAPSASHPSGSPTFDPTKDTRY